MPGRIAVGGIEHETSSFIPEPTLLEDFERRTVRGAAIASLGEANTIVDGFVRGVRENGLELVPLSWAKGTSGGQASHETFEMLKQEFITRLRDAMPVDGVLLSLHGSFAAEGVDDGDGNILEATRALVGPNCPVFAVHDLHSNISCEMAKAADALIIERTYPHTDMAERAMHAVELMARTIDGEVKPTMAYRALPLFWAAAKMITAEPPMCELIACLQAMNEQPGVLSTSAGVGYQWIDSPIAGSSTIVVTDNAPSFAQRHADDLARWIWDRRADWQRSPLSSEKGLGMGEAAGKYPIILADQADNTGGGAPGDSTEILRLFIERGLKDAAVLYMVDPEVVLIAMTAGVGATISINLGGKSHSTLGPPVQMRAEVLGVCDGHFAYDGPMFGGVKGYMGNAVLLHQNGIYVIVISERQQPIDLAFARTLKLDCAKMKYLCLKSTGHFRSGFGPIAGSIYNVDTASLLTQDFAKLPLKRLGRKIYPMDLDVALDW